MGKKRISRRKLFGIILLWFFLSTTISVWPEERAVKYFINVELLPETHLIKANETLRWTNRTQDYIPDIQLHLYWNAFKNELSTVAKESRNEGLLKRYQVKKNEGGWIKITSMTTVEGQDLLPSASFIAPDKPVNPDDQTVLRVSLPKPLSPGETITLNLEFEAQVPSNGLRAGFYRDGYFISQWFPKPGVYQEGKGWNCHQYHLNSEFFADFADFQVKITVPEKFVVGACGEEVDRKVNQALGKITYTYIQQNIHDFAWAASPRFLKVERLFKASEEITPEEYQQVANLLDLRPEEIKLPDVRMILLIEKQHRNQIERHFRALRAALKYYGLWYGPYPYRTITMVDPPFRTGSGGMEYPTLFAAGTSVILSKNVLSPEGVIIHEFGHNYWYGIVANNEFEEAWLDEGINTYSTGKVAAVAYGPGEYPLKFNGLPLNWLVKFPAVYDWQTDRLFSSTVVKLDPIVNFSWDFFNSTSYALNVYQRASTALNTLERLLGQKTMAKIMRTFQQRYRFCHPKTEDFIKVVNEVSGQNLDWFFQEFFFSTKDFDYAISSVKSQKLTEKISGLYDQSGQDIQPAAPEKAGKTWPKYETTITLRRYGEARIGPGVKMKLKVKFEDGKVEWREWDGQNRWTRFTFITPTPVQTAQLDPEHIWLVDSNLSNNS
ncbi:MAG: M1 family metallopeptidase, partial [Candidatus Saccharicenans sp.]